MKLWRNCVWLLVLFGAGGSRIVAQEITASYAAQCWMGVEGW
jgi:hypothetical protein